MRKLRFITVGLGPVGRALTSALAKAGHQPILLVGRGRTVEKILAHLLKAQLRKRLPQNIDNIDVILLTLPTNELSAYAYELSQQSLPWDTIVFIHSAGSFGAKPLEPLQKLGAGVAAMHPYQTFPKPQKSVHLTGITYGVTGNRRGVAMAMKLVRDIGGIPLKIRERDRLLYHLSAILACTFVAADVEMAAGVLKTLGISERRALQAALPIAEETIRNIGELGIRAAMTGPQTRGDKRLIQKQKLELRKHDPELAELYDHASKHIMRRIAGSKQK